MADHDKTINDVKGRVYFWDHTTTEFCIGFPVNHVDASQNHYASGGIMIASLWVSKDTIPLLEELLAIAKEHYAPKAPEPEEVEVYKIGFGKHLGTAVLDGDNIFIVHSY